MIMLNNKKVIFDSFPNGETKMSISPDMLSSSKGTMNIIHFKYETDADFIHLMFLKKYIDIYRKSDIPTAVSFLYMPYSRQDRTKNCSAFTLKYICDFINDLHFDLVHVYESHSDVTMALLNNAIAVDISKKVAYTAMEKIEFNIDKDIVFFPDAGAQKRYADDFDKCHQAVGFKHRNFSTGKIESYQVLGDIPKGARVVIIDDLCSYGGTFLAAAKALKEKGAGDIYLIVAHCEDNIFKGELLKDNSDIKKVFTTNSILTIETDTNIDVTDLLGDEY